MRNAREVTGTIEVFRKPLAIFGNSNELLKFLRNHKKSCHEVRGAEQEKVVGGSQWWSTLSGMVDLREGGEILFV